MKKRFKPWVGEDYHNTGFKGIKLLVLGESHYGDPNESRSSLTVDIVEKLVFKKRHAFFTKVAKLLLDSKAGVYLVIPIGKASGTKLLSIILSKK